MALRWSGESRPGDRSYEEKRFDCVLQFALISRIKRLVRGAHPTTAESRPGEDLYGISITFPIQSLDRALFACLISYNETWLDCALQLTWHSSGVRRMSVLRFY